MTKKRYSLLLFVLPGTALYALFFIYPTLVGLFYSFTNWDGMSARYDFTGLANYGQVARDIVFRKSLLNNVKFMLFVVIVQSALSLVFALQLAKNSRTNVFLRSLYFFPTVISSVSVGLIWSFVYDPTLGLLNGALTGAGLEHWTRSWIGDVNIAIYSVAAVQAWAHIGQMVVIFVAGIQSIPSELYEAAVIDGGNRWQVFSRVTWPLLAPAATIVVTYTTIQSFKAFDLIFTMTGGGPSYSTEILSTYIYHVAFQNYQFGYASAGSVIFLAIIALITFIQFKALRANRVHE